LIGHREGDCGDTSFLVVVGSERITAHLAGELFLTKYLWPDFPRHKEFLVNYEMMSGMGFQNAIDEILKNWDEDEARRCEQHIKEVARANGLSPCDVKISNPSTVTLGGVVYTANPAVTFPPLIHSATAGAYVASASK